MMRFLFLFILFPLVSFSNEPVKERLIGKWVGDKNSAVSYAVFDEEGFASLEIEGDIIGGKEFVIEGTIFSMTYQIIDNSDPIQLDFIVTMLDSGEEQRMFAIIQFTKSNTIRISFDEKVRPTKFNPDYSVTLKRSK